jgi:hypothetical protein
MLPSQLPQQRIHEVVDLEPWSFAFEPIAGYGQVPPEILPKRKPLNATYLCQVEWAWSPINERLDAYHLHSARAYWILWTNYWDDNWGKWEWLPSAYVPRKGVSEHLAAIQLMIALWRHCRDHEGLEPFHWINADEFLSVSDLQAIKREVWG